MNKWIMVFCNICAALVIYPSVAGPVADELSSRGANVGLPKPRPAQQFTKQNEVEHDTPSLPEPEPLQQRPAEASEAGSSSDDDGLSPVTPFPLQSACVIELMKHRQARPAAQPEAGDIGCRIPDPVELQSTTGKYAVNFPAGLVLDCRFATRLANFVADTVQPLARHHIGSALVKISSGQGFVCRRRNNADDGKLSEHGLGNATDWVGFEFAGGRILSVRDSSDMKPDEAAFFNAVRQAACGAFTTVLGPGSNEAHANHLHFDLGRTEEDKKNPYRICE